MILPELKKNWKIIDLGCGDKWLTKALKREGIRCTPLEWVSKSLPYKNNNFDCSILIETIEHLSPDLIPEIERITKRKIILTTIHPKASFLLDFLIKLKLIMPKETPHIKEYKVEDIPFKKFKIVKSRMHWIIDQFAVFERVKK